MMELPSGCRLSIEKEPAWSDREFVDARLGDYNEAFLRDARYDYFGIFVRDADNEIRAGLIGSLYGDWLFTNLLWVRVELRGRGIGRHMLEEAEARAVAFGCHWAWIDTFSFQAPEFYKKLGYQEFARLDDYPPGHNRIYLKKQLARED
jgi:GNAT superfamily N-acetyltransferase